MIGYGHGADDMKVWRAFFLRPVTMMMSTQSIWFAPLALSAVMLVGATFSGLAQPDRLQPPAPVGRKASPVAVTAQAPAPGAAPKEWSGESGSSGHPEMQAS